MNKIKQQPDHSKSINRLIELGTKQMLKNQIKKTSYANLFWSSIKFVSWKLWTLQLILVASSIFILYSKFDMRLENVVRGLTGLVLFSVIFFAEEVFKSFTSNMWELEQTLKYDLRQHMTMKLLVFASFDLLFIVILAIFAKSLLPYTFIQFALFLLAPFNIFCILLFSIFTFIRNRLSNLVFWIFSGLMIAGSMIIEAIFNVYELPTLYWTIAYLITSISLVLLIKQMLKRDNSGGIFL